MEERQINSMEVVNRLAQRWLRYFENLSGKGNSLPDKDFDAVEELDQMVRVDCDNAWLVIVEIFKNAKSDLDLANLAAGPLEDLLVKHGVKVIDRIEQYSVVNPKFKELLSGVWKSEIQEDIWRRIEEARR